MQLLHKAGALHEHAARSAGRVEDLSAFGFEHIGDQRHQRNGREELTAIVCFLVGKLGQEVFADAPEDITRHVLQFIGVERPQQLTEHFIIQLLILGFKEHAFERGIVLFDGFHRLDDGVRAIGFAGQRHQIIELGVRSQEDGTLLREILLGQLAGLTSALRQPRFDGVLHHQKAALSMAQEDQSHYGHEILVAGIVGIRAQVIRGVPKSLFNGFDIFELGHGEGNFIIGLWPPAGHVRDGAVEFVRNGGSAEVDEGGGEGGNSIKTSTSILSRSQLDEWNGFFF